MRAAACSAASNSRSCPSITRPARRKPSSYSSRRPADQGIRYIAQGNGSSVALALTNDKCNYWHFRFDADGDMKMQALTNYMAQQKAIKKVYLINQDYSFGQAVAKAARAMLAAKRPDIEIVGDDLHPLGMVKDFAPYVAKIKSSGEIYIRADNHQLVQPLYISTLVKANGKDIKYDVEKSGLGFRTDARVEGKDTVMPTTCKFQKP